MGWLESLAGMLTGGAAGGIVGLIGTGIHAWLRGRELRLTLEHERSMREIDLREIKLEGQVLLRQTEAEAEARLGEAEQRTAAAQAEMDAQIRTASYAHDRATYGGGLVDTLRGIVRPTVTGYLLLVDTILACVLLYMCRHLLMADELFVQKEAALPLLQTLVLDLSFLTTVCVTWWFGGRVIRSGVTRG